MSLKEISELQPGDIVAEDVLNNQNNILIPKGAVLSEKNIRVLKTWGVNAIHVEEAIDSLEEEDPEERKRIEELLENKFRLNAETNPFLENLKKLLLSKHLKNKDRS